MFSGSVASVTPSAEAVTLREHYSLVELPDDNYTAEVAVNVDRDGNLSQPQWLKGSGDPKWDASVKEVFKVVSNIGKPPPTNFPPQVTIRFDVQLEEVESLLQ